VSDLNIVKFTYHSWACWQSIFSSSVHIRCFWSNIVLLAQITGNPTPEFSQTWNILQL